MKYGAMVVTFVGFVLSGSAPPRETGVSIPTAQSIHILAACIEKRLGQYTESDLPGGGISIKYGERRSLLIHFPPTLYFDLTEVDGNRRIDVRYRHPMTKGAAAMRLRMTGRKCFPYELEAAGGGVLPDSG
jgi:hypothetical protein